MIINIFLLSVKKNIKFNKSLLFLILTKFQGLESTQKYVNCILK